MQWNRRCATILVYTCVRICLYCKETLLFLSILHSSSSFRFFFVFTKFSFVFCIFIYSEWNHSLILMIRLSVLVFFNFWKTCVCLYVLIGVTFFHFLVKFNNIEKNALFLILFFFKQFHSLIIIPFSNTKNNDNEIGMNISFKFLQFFLFWFIVCFFRWKQKIIYRRPFNKRWRINFNSTNIHNYNWWYGK